jgi:hypothetical protein
MNKLLKLLHVLKHSKGLRYIHFSLWVKEVVIKRMIFDWTVNILKQMIDRSAICYPAPRFFVYYRLETRLITKGHKLHNVLCKHTIGSQLLLFAVLIKALQPMKYALFDNTAHFVIKVSLNLFYWPQNQYGSSFSRLEKIPLYN